MPDTTAPIHVIDDEVTVRDLVRDVLASVNLASCGWADPLEFLSAVARLSVDALIVDVRLRGLSGLELVRSLREAGVQSPVIFVSGVAEVPVAVEAMKLGAVDFLQKPFQSQVLIDVVQAALRLRSSQRQQDAVRTRCLGLVASLSRREREVLDGVIGGNANKVIAIDLGISEKTVEEHRSRVMAKLRASSVADLVRISVMAGICDPFAAPSSPR